MSNEPEQTNQTQAAASNSKSLVDLLTVKLGLPALMGREAMNRHLLKETLITLKDIGVLNSEQINGILDRVAKRIEDIYQDMKTSPQMENELYLESVEAVNEAATSDLKKLRETLTPLPPEPPPES
jgi:hypothetical protein